MFLLLLFCFRFAVDIMRAERRISAHQTPMYNGYMVIPQRTCGAQMVRGVQADNLRKTGRRPRRAFSQRVSGFDTMREVLLQNA